MDEPIKTGFPDPEIERLREKIRHLATGEAELRRTFEELTLNAARFRHIVEDHTDFICRFLPGGVVTFVNRAVCNYLGKPPEELIGKSYYTFIPAEDLDDLKKQLSFLCDEKPVCTVVHRITMPGGGTRWHQWTNRAIFDRKGQFIEYQAVGRDITPLMEAKEALRQSEEKYRTMLNSVTDGIYKINADGYFTYLNSVSLRRSGLSPESYQTVHYLDMIVPEERQRVRANFERVMEGRENPPYELNLQGRNGKVYTLEVHSKPIFENGRIVELLGISRDITVRKQAEELLLNAKKFLENMVAERTRELQAQSKRLEEEVKTRRVMEEKLSESESRYRTIFESTGTAMAIVEEDMTVSLVNREMESLLGCPREEIEGKVLWTEFVSEKDLERMMEYHRLRRARAGSAPESYECRITDRQGNTKDLLVTVGMIPQTRRSVASLMDITERKQTEETVRRRETDLEIKARELEELNTALKVLLKRREDDRMELEDRVSHNVRSLIQPHLGRLKKSAAGEKEKALISMIESNLTVIISPFTQKLSSKTMNLTPKEIEVANLIKEGKTTKEIAEHMNVSKSAIDTHRDHIRKKLGLKNKKMNLRSYLHSIS
jgi:PAS domain S-box-containing protein